MKLNGTKRDKIMKEADEVKIPFSSNNIRLSGREWIIAAIVCSALLCLGPALWGRLEKFDPGTDYRLPYTLGNDYWLYGRYCRWACSKYDTLVVGDSVIWGHYVSGDNTLSHYLNQNAGRDRFANLGVDGFHPGALGGLLNYFGRDISGKNVIIQFNPLWMSSAKHDLQTEKVLIVLARQQHGGGQRTVGAGDATLDRQRAEQMNHGHQYRPSLICRDMCNQSLGRWGHENGQSVALTDTVMQQAVGKAIRQIFQFPIGDFFSFPS